MFGRALVAVALALSVGVAPAPEPPARAAGGGSSAQSVVATVAQVPAATTRPRATLAASGQTLASGRVLVTVRSNARKVTLAYRSASGRARTAAIRLRAGHGALRLAAGSTRIRARARATARLRASVTVRVVPTSVPSAEPPPGDPQPSSGTTAEEAQVVVLVNEARATARTCGTTAYPPASALAVHDLLARSARAHSLDMATNGYFSHTGLDGSQPWDRMTAVGYDWTAAGENIAAGQPTPEAVVTAWLASPGHCSNIMSDRYTEIGVGYASSAASTYRHYWTQNFGRR